MGNDLEGKVILLAGAASGIGRECALAYAREGATIAILNRNFEEAEGRERIGQYCPQVDVIADAAAFLLSPIYRRMHLAGKRRRRAWLQTLTGMEHARIQN